MSPTIKSGPGLAEVLVCSGSQQIKFEEYFLWFGVKVEKVFAANLCGYYVFFIVGNCDCYRYFYGLVIIS